MSARAEFSRISLTDVKLPPEQKSRIWRSHLASNTAAMQIISRIAEKGLSEERAYHLVEDTLKVSGLIEQYAENSLGYRGKSIPSEIYYGTLGRVFANEIPDAFDTMPPACHRLSAELKKLQETPTAHAFNTSSPFAQFCHAIDLHLDLGVFLYALREGSVAYDENDTSAYDRLVGHVKDDIPHAVNLFDDIKTITQDIDFVINGTGSRGTDLTWFCDLAHRHKENVADKSIIYDETMLPDAPLFRSAFYRTYDEFSAHNEDIYSSFYEFSQKVLAPISMFGHYVGEEGVRPATLVYAIAAPALRESNDPDALALSFHESVANISLAMEFPDLKDIEFAKLGTCRKQLDILSAVMGLTDLGYAYHRIKKNIIQPYVSYQQMLELHDKLNNTELLVKTIPGYSDYIDFYRTESSRVYNAIVCKNGSVFDPYHGPKLT